MTSVQYRCTACKNNDMPASIHAISVCEKRDQEKQKGVLNTALSLRLGTVWIMLIISLSCLAQEDFGLSECRQLLKQNEAQQAQTLCLELSRQAELQGNMDLAIEASLLAIDAMIELRAIDRALAQIAKLMTIPEDQMTVEQEYRLIRKKGKSFYYKERFSESIEAFREGLALAERELDTLRIGKSLNDMGSIFRSQRMSEEALDYYTRSLTYKRKAADHHAIGMTLYNIGNIYRDTKDHQNAIEQFVLAMEAFERDAQDETDQRGILGKAHALENIGYSYAALQQPEAASRALEQSMQIYQEYARYAELVRVQHTWVRVLLEQGQTETAASALNQATEIAKSHDVELGTTHLELSAKVAESQERYAEMYDLANRGNQISETGENLTGKVLFSKLIASALFQQGATEQAYDWLQKHAEMLKELEERQYNEALATARTQYDLQRRENQIQTLEKDIQIRALRQQQWVLGSILVLLVLVSLFGFWWWRRHKERQDLQQRIEGHLKREQELRDTHKRLLGVLDNSLQPVAIVDQSNHIRFANKAMLRKTQMSFDTIEGQDIETLLPNIRDNQEFAQLSEDDDVVILNNIRLSNPSESDQGSTIELLIQSDGSLAICILDASDGTSDLTRASVLGTLKQLDALKSQLARLQSKLGSLNPNSEEFGWLSEQLEKISSRMESVLSTSPVDDLDQQYRESLIALMQSALDAWEESTGKSKLDLAEQSGIWRLSIDDGRLRTRSLDRYFSVSKLPANPRWRQVLRTVHFVMAKCALSADKEAVLNEKLSRFEVLQQARL